MHRCPSGDIREKMPRFCVSMKPPVLQPTALSPVTNGCGQSASDPTMDERLGRRIQTNGLESPRRESKACHGRVPGGAIGPKPPASAPHDHSQSGPAGVWRRENASPFTTHPSHSLMCWCNPLDVVLVATLTTQPVTDDPPHPPSKKLPESARPPSPEFHPTHTTQTHAYGYTMTERMRRSGREAQRLRSAGKGVTEGQPRLPESIDNVLEDARFGLGQRPPSSMVRRRPDGVTPNFRRSFVKLDLLGNTIHPTTAFLWCLFQGRHGTRNIFFGKGSSSLSPYLCHAGRRRKVHQPNTAPRRR